MNLYQIAFWIYLSLAILSIAIPIAITFFKPPETWFTSKEANNFTWLSDEDIKRLNFHLDREKFLLDYWRKVIVRLNIIQSYVTLFSVVSSILLASLAPLSNAQQPEITHLISLVSIHLAITLGLFKAFKVEKLLNDALQQESAFYLLFYRFQDESSSPEAAEGSVDKYFMEYDKIRASLYQTEIAGIPSPQQK